jgi:hypothetical protein
MKKQVQDLTLSSLVDIYRVIKTSMCAWWLQSKTRSIWLFGSDRQGQGDSRITPTPSLIPNCNYVIMVSDWNCLKYFCVFFCTVIIRCTETFLSFCISTFHKNLLSRSTYYWRNQEVPRIHRCISILSIRSLVSNASTQFPRLFL